MEGKWLYDGFGNRPARVAEENSFHPEDETWAPGLRDFAMFVASKMLKPTDAENFGQGRWGPTEYFHATYPEASFEDTTPEVATWDGSDGTHFFKGKMNITHDDELLRRKRMCMCDPCVEGNSLKNIIPSPQAVIIITNLQALTTTARATKLIKACGTAKQVSE
jgi:hypothetical protein